MAHATAPTVGAPTLVEAFALHRAGLSIIPIRADGTKKPAVNWKDYQHRLPTVTELGGWFKNGEHTGMAVVCGAVSGGLEMTEIEGRAADQLPAIKAALELNAPGGWERLTCVERSPSGGVHWFYRLAGEPVPGNLRIAAATGREVLAETRGGGGYTIIAPTSGAHHPTGHPWVREAGHLAKVPTISPADRAALHCALFHVLDETPGAVCKVCGLLADRSEPAPAPAPVMRPRPVHPVEAGEGGLSPLDDYEQRNDLIDLLQAHGWSLTDGNRAGEHVRLTRPGKQPHEGQSATVHSDMGRQVLHVFTSSTDFEPGGTYTTARALAVLTYGKDDPAAMSDLAKTLARDGYGERVSMVDALSFFRPGKLPEPAPAPPVNAQQGTEQPAVVSAPAAGQGPAPTQPPAPAQADADASAPPQTTNTLLPAPTAEDVKANLTALALAQGAADGTDQAGAIVFLSQYRPWVKATHHDDKHIWHVWDGTRWTTTGATGHIRTAYLQTMTIRPDDPDGVKTNKRKWQGARTMDGVLKMAANMPEVRVSEDQFDARPWELNTPGGIVNLRTGQVLPHDPSHLHTKLTAADPTSTGGRELWEGFLTRVLPDPQVREFMQQVAGLALIGQVLEHVFIFAYGQGANGKSVFFDVLGEVLGDYATTVDAGTIMHKRNERETALELGKFAGHRLVVMSEVNMDDRINEAMLKTLTGGDKLHVRALYRNGQTVRPQHTLFMAGNHRPALPSGGGHSMWRRMRVVPFGEQIPAHEQDPLLKEKLLGAGGAVLAWAIEGAVSYQRAGRLVTPVAVESETRAYRLAADPFEAFMAGALVVRAGASAGASDVQRAFETFCANSGLTGVSWSRLEYPRRLRAAGANSHRLKTGVIYEGVELLLERDWSYPGEG